MKIELVQKLAQGQYVCDEFPNIDQSFLNSEKGRQFVESFIKHENKFTCGRCTVDGYSNCERAYRCLTCGFLCSTDEDLPEILSAITIQRNRVVSMDEDLSASKDVDKLKVLNHERDKSLRRIVILMQKVRKIQRAVRSIPEDLMVEVNPFIDDSVIRFE